MASSRCCGPLIGAPRKARTAAPTAEELPAMAPQEPPATSGNKPAAIQLAEAEATNRELEKLTSVLGQRLSVLEEKAMAFQADLQPALVEFLVKTAHIDQSIVDYVTMELQMQSMADFANYFTNANYEMGMRNEIVANVAGFGENLSAPKSMLQISRLRSAWNKAQNMDTWSPLPGDTKQQGDQSCATKEPKEEAPKEEASTEPMHQHKVGRKSSTKTLMHVVGMGWTSPPIAITTFDGLWAALIYKVTNPEKFMDVTDVVLADRPGYLARAMTIKATKTRVEEHVYANERTGELIYRLVNSKTKHETEDERVIAVKEGPLRLEFFHRHVSDGYRVYWQAPVEPVKRMAQELLAHISDANSKGKDIVGLGVLSNEITDVSHDALWRAMVASVREPARYFSCSDVKIQECKGFVQRTLTANGKTYVENVYDDEEVCEIVYRKVVDGAESDMGRVVALRTHPLQLEFHQRNMTDGFRHPWDMPKSAPLSCVEGFVREAKRMDSAKPTTVGYGVTSDPVRHCPYDTLWAALALCIREPWRVMDVDPSSCSIEDCQGYVQRRVTLSATGETVVERITVNEEAREVAYCKCDANGQPSSAVRVIEVHTPLRLELYERNADSGLRVDWKAPYGIAISTLANIVKLANQLGQNSSDTVGFGMASKPITGVSQDALWKAMLYTIRHPAQSGMKVDSVSCVDMEGFLQRTMRLVERPGSPTVMDHIRVIESAQEITYRPVVDNQESEEERVFALRSDPLSFEVFCRHSKDEMRLDWQAPKSAASAVFKAVMSESQRM